MESTATACGSKVGRMLLLLFLIPHLLQLGYYLHREDAEKSSEGKLQGTRV